MRVVIVISFMIPSLVNAAGQGSIFFGNHVPNWGVDAPVFDSLGNRLDGSRYRAAMYAGSTTSSLEFRTETPFLAGAESGYFDGGVITATGFLPGIVTWVQITAWDSTLGSSYEAVRSLGIGGYGESTVFQVLPGDPDGGVPSPPGFFTELRSFNLVVPEPRFLWIAAIGLPIFWCTHRWRSDK